MTREEAKELLPLIQAYAEGAEIQRKVNSGWINLKEADFSAPAINYRVKPEPKYIPFDYSDAEKIVGKAVRINDGNYEAVKVVTEITPDGRMRVGGLYIPAEIILERCTFFDGSPCGKIAE